MVPYLIRYKDDPRVLITDGVDVRHIPDEATLTWHQGIIRLNGGNPNIIITEDQALWNGLLTQMVSVQPDVDEEALAAALAPLLPGVTPADAKKIADAVIAEIAS